MKLLWITHRRQSEMSSTSRMGIASALEARDWDVKFMSPDGDYRIERSSKIGKGHRSFTRSVSSVLRTTDLDSFSVVIVEWTGVEGAAEILEKESLPWIMMDRSPPVSSGVIGWFQRKQYNKAWGIARSQGSGRAVKSTYMAASQKWDGPSSIVPAGVDPTIFEIATMNENPLIVCHGSLDRSRELHRLTTMDVNLLLFGEGNDSRRLAKITRVESAGEVAPRLACADIGVMHLPNRDVWKHASPLKVAEFAAAGLLVVASDVSGLEKYRDAGWLTLVPLGDDVACKTALHALCELPIEERRRLGVLARKESERSMTWGNCTGPLHTMLLEVKR
ncbi:MAG: glycosyltransferase [Candidatus Poseidoniales archaeon]|nr:glycosyltransferase [Candidatus Poseidoniales archaeon]